MRFDLIDGFPARCRAKDLKLGIKHKILFEIVPDILLIIHD
jgi:hypothetical protein